MLAHINAGTLDPDNAVQNQRTQDSHIIVALLLYKWPCRGKRILRTYIKYKEIFDTCKQLKQLTSACNMRRTIVGPHLAAVPTAIQEYCLKPLSNKRKCLGQPARSGRLPATRYGSARRRTGNASFCGDQPGRTQQLPGGLLESARRHASLLDGLRESPRARSG